jgi:hypothetical protein
MRTFCVHYASYHAFDLYLGIHWVKFASHFDAYWPFHSNRYTSRFALKGRVSPPTQHKIFIGMTVFALSHAGYVMSQDSTTTAGA